MPLSAEDDLRDKLAAGTITALGLDTSVFDSQGLNLAAPPLEGDGYT